VFIYEYSGFGGSGGKPSLQQLCRDSKAAFDFVCDKFNKRPSEVVLYGESFGGAISAWLSWRRPVKALIIKSTFTSFVRIARELCVWIRIYPESMFPHPRLDVSQFLRNAAFPLLIIHGRLDRLARWPHAVSLQEASGGTLLELENSRHAKTPPEDEEKLRNGVAEFVQGLNKSVPVLEKA
jgi:hypothetical protein